MIKENEDSLRERDIKIVDNFTNIPFDNFHFPHQSESSIIFSNHFTDP
jgi:hypothetical protein